MSRLIAGVLGLWLLLGWHQAHSQAQAQPHTQALDSLPPQAAQFLSPAVELAFEAPAFPALPPTDSARSGPLRRPLITTGSEADFLARYGTSDSNRALIRYWFAHRATSTVFVALGSVAMMGGAVGYLGNAAENVALNVLPGGPTVIKPVNSAVHILFFGGLAVSGLGAVQLSSFSKANLRLALEQHSRLSDKQWSQAIAQYGTLRAQFDQAPTAPTTADEALRLQQDYWRQKGARRAKPKQ